ncbi:MAG: hypothetical protein Q8N99_01690 [Nanoarchaeota archaeon]|nr:hypothetical protein [Nanoarchaeota archaeon]
MAYKKYIKRGNKLCGPYYYESYRDKDGNVKRRYLGTVEYYEGILKEKNKLRVVIHTKEKNSYFPRINKRFFINFLAVFLIVIGIVLLGLLLFSGFNYLSSGPRLSGFVISENMTNEQVSQVLYENEIIRQELNSSSVALQIREPTTTGETINENLNSRLDFEISGKKLRLYFDLLNYSSFTYKIAEKIAIENMAFGGRIIEKDNITFEEHIIENITIIENQSISNETSLINETINKTIENETIINESIITEPIINETVDVVDKEKESEKEDKKEEKESMKEEKKKDKKEESKSPISSGLVSDIENNNLGNNQETLPSEPPPTESSGSETSSSGTEIPVSENTITGNLIRFFGFVGRIIGIDTGETDAGYGTIGKTGNETIQEVTNQEVRDKLQELDKEEIEKISSDSSINADDFDVIINNTPTAESPNIKWGYQVRLNDLKFLAKISITSEEELSIYNTNSLRIGRRNILSFKDLEDSGYKVRFEEPSLEINTNSIEVKLNTAEINENVLSDNNSVNLGVVNASNETTGNIIDNNESIVNVNNNASNQSLGDSVNSGDNSDDINNNASSEPEQTGYGVTGNVIKFFGFVGRVVGLVEENQTQVQDIKYNNTITIYIERDFTGNPEGYKIGDIINLDPTLIIIEISKAEHLDSNRSFISDIYEQVKAIDGNWSEIINNSHYVRAYFSKNLTRNNDITIYARASGWNNSIVIDGKEVSYDIYLMKKRIDELKRELNMS